MIDMLDENAIVDSICRLSTEDGLLEKLSAEAISREIKTWNDYGKQFYKILKATNDHLMQPDIRIMNAYTPLGY